MEVLEGKAQLQTFIRRNRIALIAFAKKGSSEWEYARRLLTRLESRAGYLMSFAIADKSLEEAVASNSEEIVIRLYLESKPVFEQQGVFGKQDLDYEALRRGIKAVLKRHSIKTLF